MKMTPNSKKIKTGNEEDQDVETIISCMNAITRVLALKMFDYGKKIRLLTTNK